MRLLPGIRLFRALRHRNFRLFITGQSVSMIGTWMQVTALGWLVYRLSDSAFLLGLVGFVGQIPTLLLTPLTGVLADRLNRHRIILMTQSLAMLQALLLAALVLSGQIQVWHIVGLSVALGLVNALDMPARQSFLLELVEGRENLSNAIALNSAVINAGRLLGPAIGGLLIAALGEGFCFLLNGLSFGAVIAALLMMRFPARESRVGGRDVLHDLREGVSYAFGFGPIRSILLFVALMSLLGMPYSILMPVFAADILQGGPHGLGLLMGSAGVGALTGTLYLASRTSVLGLGKWLVRAAVIFGVALTGFSLSPLLPLSCLLLLIAGFGLIVHLASCNTLLQTIADDDKRGRVMSFYTMAFMGMTPWGYLLAGSLADWIGAPATLSICGAASLLGALLFARHLPALRRQVQPIYARIGILPELAQGLQTATEPTRPPRR